MRRKTDFKQMFLIDSSLYKRMNVVTSSPPKPVSEIPKVPPSVDALPDAGPTHKVPPSVDALPDAGPTHKDDIRRQPTQPKNEKFFDSSDPIVKALKEDYEKSDEPAEPPAKKAKYIKNDNEIDFKEMIKEIDEEIKNWNELRKDAVKMQANAGRKRKQPRYVHYFADKDGSARRKST